MSLFIFCSSFIVAVSSQQYAWTPSPPNTVTCHDAQQSYADCCGKQHSSAHVPQKTLHSPVVTQICMFEAIDNPESVVASDLMSDEALQAMIAQINALPFPDEQKALLVADITTKPMVRAFMGPNSVNPEFMYGEYPWLMPGSNASDAFVSIVKGYEWDWSTATYDANGTIVTYPKLLSQSVVERFASPSMYAWALGNNIAQSGTFMPLMAALFKKVTIHVIASESYTYDASGNRQPDEGAFDYNGQHVTLKQAAETLWAPLRALSSDPNYLTVKVLPTAFAVGPVTDA